MTKPNLVAALQTEGGLGGPISRRGAMGLFGLGLAGTALLGAGCANSPSPSPSPTAVPSAIDNPVVLRLSELVKLRWPQAEQIWPGHDYSQHDLIAVQVSDNLEIERAWLINTKTAYELGKDAHSKLTAPAAFADVTYEGRKGVAINIKQFSGTSGASLADSTLPQGTERDADTLFRVASHELVHFYHQDRSTASASANRDTVYPVDPAPRTLRRMLLQRLQDAASNEQQRAELLGKASHWHTKWSTEFATEAEAIHTFDIREGGADYFERHLARYDLDTPKDEATYTAFLVSTLPKPKAYAAVDGESYALGFVTGLLLDMSKPGWQKDFYASGKTPVQLLLEGIAPIADVVDPSIEAEVNQVVSEANAVGKPAIERVDQALADPSVAYLTYQGNLAQMGYESSYSYQGNTVLLNPMLELNVEGGHISVKALTAFTNPSLNNYVIPLMPDSYSYSGNTLTAKGPEITGSATATLTKDQGRDIYTVKLVG